MAIYSLHHGSVGKSTQAQPGTAGAHVRYITREGAARVVMSEHMPEDRNAARTWMDAQEATDRKNARVIDKVMVAIPVELNAEERAELVRAFMADVTGDRVPWMAAVHDRDDDAHNPHAHIIIRDRDRETGKRAIGLSERGSTDRLREAWEIAANHALEQAGYDVRIDRRSLEDQGIAREAGIHVGPNVHQMEERGIRPESKVREVAEERVVNWPEIDRGRTRADRQREIESENRDREAIDSRAKGEGDPALKPVAGDNTLPNRAEALEKRPQDASKPDLAPDPAEQQTRPQAGPSDPLESRKRWAETLKGFADEPEVSIPLAQESEPSRLRSAISAGWQALSGLASRLEMAFQRIGRRGSDSTPDPAPTMRPPQVQPSSPSQRAVPRDGPGHDKDYWKRRLVELLDEEKAKRQRPPDRGPTLGR